MFIIFRSVRFLLNLTLDEILRNCLTDVLYVWNFLTTVATGTCGNWLIIIIIIILLSYSFNRLGLLAAWENLNFITLDTPCKKCLGPVVSKEAAWWVATIRRLIYWMQVS